MDINILDIIAILPLKVKTENNLFNLEFKVLGNNKFSIQYKNFFNINTDIDKRMTQEFIISKESFIKSTKTICELLFEAKAVEIGENMELKGNINIVKTYKTVEYLERVGY